MPSSVADGHRLLNPVPIVPLGFKKPPRHKCKRAVCPLGVVGGVFDMCEGKERSVLLLSALMLRLLLLLFDY